MLDPARLTADVLDLLPRKQISRAMGGLAGLRAPRLMLEPAIRAFIKAYDIDLDEAIVPRGGYRSFDDFFTRHLKPGARPLDPDPQAVLSPADGRVEDLGPIDPSGTLQVKGKPYGVAELLGDETAAQRFAGGLYFIVYLSPRDYHRVHAPVGGVVTQARHVPGTLFPVNAIGLEHVPKLFAVNERVAITQACPIHGEVVTVMVGAIGVGSISVSFDDLRTNVGQSSGGVREYGPDGPPLDRGEELGTFHLGSTAIVFLPPPAGDSLVFVPSPGASVRMGEAVARAREGAR
ncbi:MAG: phosphatidylserine decarboxylase [Myxococcales bacterium]|nr:phosphatidylserine decarboxylase [Myxococcales bacterium]